MLFCGRKMTTGSMARSKQRNVCMYNMWGHKSKKNWWKLMVFGLLSGNGTNRNANKSRPKNDQRVHALLQQTMFLIVCLR